MFANAFKKTGTIEYDGTVLLDTFRNVYPVFDRVVSKYQTEKYTIVGSPEPAVLASILYNNPEYYWVFLLLNEVTNPFDDWLLCDSEVYRIAEEIYNNVDGLHHYEDSDGNFYYDLVEHNGVYYDVGDTNFTKPFYQRGPLNPVTNVEYLQAQNEKRRVIKIIRPEDITQFISDLKKEFSLDG